MNIEHLTHDLYWDEILKAVAARMDPAYGNCEFHCKSLRIVLTRGFGVKIVWCVCVCVAQCQPQKGAAWWEMSLKLKLFLQRKTHHTVVPEKLWNSWHLNPIISRLGNRKVIFKSALGWDMLVPRRVTCLDIFWYFWWSLLVRVWGYYHLQLLSCRWHWCWLMTINMQSCDVVVADQFTQVSYNSLGKTSKCRRFWWSFENTSVQNVQNGPQNLTAQRLF